MNINKRVYFLGIFVLFCTSLWVSCTDDYPGSGEGESVVPLRFSASVVSGEPDGTRALRDTIGNTGFKPDGTAYIFKISVKKETGSKGPLFEGSDNMQMRLQYVLGAWTCNFRSPDGLQLWNDRAVADVGKSVRVVACWQANENPDVSAGIPFDFSQNTREYPQPELLFIHPSDQVQTVPVGGEMSLRFSRAYTQVVVNVRKKMNKPGTPVELGPAIRIENLSGEWIKNKGSIDAATGLPMTGTSAGVIYSTVGSPGSTVDLPADTDRTFRFFVPSFMDSGVTDEAIGFSLMIDGRLEYFPLLREHLNGESGKYGFAQGYINTYNLVYDNTELTLRLKSWNSVRPSGSFGNETGSDYTSSTALYQGSGSWVWLARRYTRGKALGAADHRYEGWLSTVRSDNNGGYKTLSDKLEGTDGIESDGNYGLENADVVSHLLSEHVYPALEVAHVNVSENPVVWEGEDGVLVAKELCRKWRYGQKTNWRLPRASELRFVIIYTTSSGRDPFRNTQKRPFWSGTEYSRDKAWAVGINEQPHLFYQALPKDSRAYVRCVREKY